MGVPGTGRRPTPTGILKLRGSKHATNRPDEPRPELALPEPPEELRPQDRKHFREVAERLYHCGVLTSIDGASLARYATCFGRWMSAEKALAAGEPTHHEIRDGLGNIIRVIASAAYSTACKEGDRLLALEREFGLTPASRPRLQAHKPAIETMEDVFRELL